MPALDLDALWTTVVEDFRRGVRTDRWDAVLHELSPAALEGDELLLAAPSHARGWVRERLLVALGTSASRVLGRTVTVRLARPGVRPDPGARSTARGGRQRDEPAHDPVPPRPLHPRYRFDTLVLGEANRLGHAAALAVAEDPGDSYNPLFLCGPPGVGKTHLLHAVGHFVLAHRPGARIALTTGEAFVTDFTAALRRGGIDDFKRRHRRTDLLLVDDVQFLMDKPRTEEEFFHTFNALHDAGAQVVLTCDRAPGDLAAMMLRLRERFAAGLVAEMGPPELAMRLTILRKRMAQDRVEVADDAVLDLIARRVTSSARAVEAAFVRVVAYASLLQAPLTRETTDRALTALGAEPPPARRSPGRRGAGTAAAAGTPAVADVVAAAARVFGLEPDDLLGRRTDRRTVRARRIAMHLARAETGLSYPALGKAFGRNHTTVLGADRDLGRALPDDEALRLDVDRVRGALDDAQGGDPDAHPPA